MMHEQCLCLLDSKKDDKVAVPVCAQEHPTSNWSWMSSACVCWTARKIMTLTSPTPSPEGSVCTTETLLCVQVRQNPVCATESILCAQVSRRPLFDLNRSSRCKSQVVGWTWTMIKDLQDLNMLMWADDVSEINMYDTCPAKCHWGKFQSPSFNL